MKVPKLPKVNAKKPFEVAGKLKKAVDNRVIPGKNEARFWRARLDESEKEKAELRMELQKAQTQLTGFVMEKKPLRKRDSRRIIIKKKDDKDA